MRRGVAASRTVLADAARRVAVVATLASLPAGLTGCIPWLMAETAETVPPGAIRIAGGVAALAPPLAPTRALPVPQLGVTVGAVEGVDVAVTYVAPLTGHTRVRARLVETGGIATAGALGFGVHGVPDVEDIGRVFGVPFATAGLQLSTLGPAPRWHGGLRAVFPFHVGDLDTATLWLAPRVGVELGGGRFRWGGELGAVISTLQPERAQLLVGLSARWIALP